METNELQNRNFVIGGHYLPVEILLDEERFYNAAAELLNKKIKYYEKKYSETPHAKIMALASFDLIVCLMRYCNPLEAADLQ